MNTYRLSTIFFFLLLSCTIGFFIGRTFKYPYFGTILFPFFVFGLFRYFTFRALKKFEKEGCKVIPGPEPLFPDGNVFDLLNEDTIPHALTKIAAEHNFPPVIKVFMGPVPVIVISSPSGMKEILRDSKAFVKGSLFEQVKPILGTPLFNVEGEVWKKHRHLINPAFRTETIKQLSNKVFVKQSEILVNLLKEKNGEPVNILEALSHFSFDIIGEAGFGYDVGSQSRMVSMFKDVKSLARELVLLALPGGSLIPFIHKRCQKYVDPVDTVVFDIFEKYSKNGLGGKDLNLLKLIMENGQFDSKQVRDETIGFLLAGHDTVAVGIAFTLVTLSKHPKAQKKVQKELDQVLGKKKPSWEDVQNLPYLKAALMESLRHYPPLQLFNREAAEDKVIEGYFIPKGSNILIFPYCVSSNPRVYPSPEEFKPERFLNGPESQNHEFAVFGSGPRLCIGKSFAISEALISLAMIYQSFDTSLMSEIVLSKVAITVSTKSDQINVKFTPR